MPKTAAIYARYSTDLQNDKSVEDQIALCRSYAKKAGIMIAQVYSDRALSGSSTIKRVGFQAMMRDAGAGKFDIILSEAVDRISRDQADYHAARKKIAFFGIQLHTPHGGEVSAIEGSMRALMGEFFIEDLKRKVHRGLSGVIRDGRNAGGKAYGYKPIAGRPGELEIIEAEARVIRRIFKEFIAGKPPRAIAIGLTKDRIAPPRGEIWRASTINGNPKRRNGILQNPIYNGQIVWNRVHMLRDPATGNRVSRPNPESEWKFVDAPHLAIVPKKVFEAAQKEKARRSITIQSVRRAPKRVLSGLLKCSCCGAGMAIKDRENDRIRIMCVRAKETKSCDNRRPYYLDTIERGAISGLAERLGRNDALAAYANAYNEERKRMAAKAASITAKLENQLASAERALQRAVKAIIDGAIEEAEARPQMERLREERDRAREALQSGPEKPATIRLHPATVAKFLRTAEKLQSLLQTGFDENDAELIMTFRELVSRVVIYPPKKNALFASIEVEGRLDVLAGGLNGSGGALHPNPPVMFRFRFEAA